MSKKSERTRQRIVEAANRLFYHKGYCATSFSDIVEAAEVPRGNIYYYFKTKEEILQSAISYRSARIKSMLSGWSDEFRTPIERLRRFLEILPDSMDAIVQFGCPMGSLSTELGKLDPELQLFSRTLFLLFEDWLDDQFAELGYAGQSRQLAKRLLARGQGISLMAQVYRDKKFLLQETDVIGRWLNDLAAGAPGKDSL